MAKDDTLRRGKPETRTHFERAKDEFDDAKGETRVTQRNDVCPDCGAVMTLEKAYKGKQSYRFTGTCSANPDHNILRYGYFSNEGTD
jgi:hypothetical protein